MFHGQVMPMMGNAVVMPRVRQDELEFMLHEHAQWLRSGGQEGKRASFRDMDMRDCDVRGADFSFASLRGANLQGMDISHTIFQEADLTDANLEMTLALACNFYRANFTGAYARGAVFAEAYMVSAQCMNANFSEADMSSAVLQEAVLRSTDCSATNFTFADMSAAICRGAVMNYAIFDRATLQHTDMRDVQMRYAVLSQARLHQAMFKDALLDGVSLLDVDFSVAQDIAPEYQAQLIAQARALIASEREAMMSDKVRLLQEENALQEVKANLEVNIARTSQNRAMQEATASMTEIVAERMRQLSWVWFAVLTGYVSVVLWVAKDIAYENLQVTELGVVAGVLAMVMGLFIYTSVVCARTSKNMRMRAVLIKDKE